MVGDDEFHRVHVGEGSGKELIHMATLGVEPTDRDPICGQLWITTASSTGCPPLIHRKYTGLFLFQPTGMSRTVPPGCSAAARATDGGATFCAFSVGRAAPRAGSA